MKNDSLGTSGYIALGEERDSEAWRNKLFTSCAFFSTALGCPCGCRRCFCRKRGGDGIGFLPCLPCFELSCHLPRTELACSICLVPDHLGARDLKAWLRVLSLKSMSRGTTSGSMLLSLESRTRKCAGQEENYPVRNIANFFPGNLAWHHCSSPWPCRILMGGRAEWTLLFFKVKGFSFCQHSFLVGRV